MARTKKERTCIVKHIMKNGVYNGGDRASFSLSYAARLIKEKRAVLDDPNVSMTDIGVAAAKEAADDTGLDTRTHELTVGDVKELVGEIEDKDELVALSEGERNHPVNAGGRKGVHEAIKARIEELESE